MIEPVDLENRFSLFSEPWHPKVVGELNDSYVKLVKLKGEFVWHQHPDEDELFIAMKGVLKIKLRDRDLQLTGGQFVIIPKGMEHVPVAEAEVQVILLEPKSVRNTGTVRDEKTGGAELV